MHYFVVRPANAGPPDSDIYLTRLQAGGRTLLNELYDAAVAGASPGPVTSAALVDLPIHPGNRIWLYSLGKAAYTMAAAATTTLQRSLHRIDGGIIVGTEELPSPCSTVSAVKGDHPLPGRHSFAAAERLGASARGKRGDDVAIVLLSGGISSLIAAPLRGMSEADLCQLFESLLGSGLDITAMNSIRKRFTQWGAGRFALALAPARTYCLIMSDVLGDDPADIGSGPCTADDRVVSEVIDVLEKSKLFERLALAMREHLASVGRGVIPETPKRTHPAFAHVTTRIIGSNRLALDAVQAYARTRSMDVEIVSTPIIGEAALCGNRIAEALIERAQVGRRGCMVWGGETTVQLASASASAKGSATHPPSGGRCQELALSAAKRLATTDVSGYRISLLAAGTDGRDGNTNAAGAFADPSLWPAIRAAGYDPDVALRRHESHAVLGACNALLPQRSTGTNVMDVVIGLIE